MPVNKEADTPQYREVIKMDRNEACWCGSGKKYKKCHMATDEKIALLAEQGEIVPTRDMLKTEEQIQKIRKSADLNTAVLDMDQSRAVPHKTLAISIITKMSCNMS